MKKIDTLVSDIYDVFLKPHEVSEENLEKLGEDMKECVKTAITNAGERRKPHLRMSVIGKPDRQLYYELTNEDDSVVEFGEEDIFEPNPEKFLKFLFGDLIEQLLVFLIRESGHTITHMQEEVEIDGVLGHTDGAVDGVVADIKTASGWAFKNKFANRALLKPGHENDPFGYIGQLSAYYEKLSEDYPDEISDEEVAWIVFNKETGEILLLKADSMELINAQSRIEHLKDVLSKPEPPEEKCFPDKPDGKSGNKQLHKSCTWCPFKKKCWKDANGGLGLRKFRYSTGDRYLTHVENLPRVEEIIEDE